MPTCEIDNDCAGEVTGRLYYGDELFFCEKHGVADWEALSECTLCSTLINLDGANVPIVKLSPGEFAHVDCLESRAEYRLQNLMEGQE